MSAIKDYIKTHRWLLSGTGLIILAAAFIVWRAIYGSTPERLHAKRGPIVEAVYALGAVKADNTYTIKLGVYSSIKTLYVQEGDLVQRGAPLLMTDSFINFNAPFTGTVTAVYYKTGENVLPGAPVMTMMDLKHLYILLSLDQESALRTRIGQKAELSFESIRGQKLTGTVDKIYPSNGQFLVKVIVKDMPEGVLPEMSADVAVEVARRENALLVPMSTVKRGNMTIYRDGKKQQISVKIGAINGDWGELLEGDVQPADELVVQNGN